MITKTPVKPTHRRVEESTTINRQYVRRPDISKGSPAKKIPVSSRTNISVSVKKPVPIPTELPSRVKVSSVASKSKTPSMQKSTIKKDTAIKSAMSSVATMDKSKEKFKARSVFSWKRILAAFLISGIVVFAIVFCVNQSIPNFSLYANANQAGFDAVYPTFIPREFSQSSITSESGKVSITFKSADNHEFILHQEPSSWSSATLESNFVKDKFTDYTVVREQGLTLYISGSSCAWVNGGKFFLIESPNGTLSKKQLKSIAVSL